MLVSKTDSVFRRYNIVDEHDLEEAAQALDRKKEASQKKEVSQSCHKNPSDTPSSEENKQESNPPQDTVLQ